MMGATLNTERVRLLRSALGITQLDLAVDLDLPASSVARLENGRLEADEATLNTLAKQLACATETLMRPAPDVLNTRPWLRAYADAPKKTVDQYVADTLIAVEVIDLLKLRRMPDRLPTFDGDANSDYDIDEFAADVRHAADINSDTGVPNVTRAAERLGCVVLPMENELGKHLGLSFRADETPIIRVSRATARVPGDRQRFTVAHELGHILLHATCPPPESSERAKIIETQAHRFAAAFLLPGDAFLDDLDDVNGRRVTLSTLATLKERWGVSIKAMVVRLQQLARIDADQSRSLYKQISARGWNTGEPVYVGNEQAVWFGKALRQRFPKDVSFLHAAALSGLDASWFERWMAWEEPELTGGPVIDLDARRAHKTGGVALRQPDAVRRPN
jgi:Zn-dependent peptidase ImmA (M78 family)/DNA-binding XRE family transcriptional regulator